MVATRECRLQTREVATQTELLRASFLCGQIEGSAPCDRLVLLASQYFFLQPLAGGFLFAVYA